MTETIDCPRCGKRVPPDAPAELCPNCLLAGGLLDLDESGVDNAAFTPTVARTTPASGSPIFDVPSPARLGPLFPNLEIQGLLGQGGMGAVYRARQTKLDRLVALKIIRPEQANDPAFAERFNREPRTLARMNHPHIVGVHDFGEVQTDGATMYFFVMEFVDGANLREVLHNGRVSAEQATMIVGQVCKALQYAHDEGVVHRDIKPENILLNHRADIYSLGVVFYEMLTGTLPLGSFDPPSLKTGGAAGLDRVVLKALASDPQRRFQQVSEFARELYAASPTMASSMSVHGGAPQPWPGPSTIMENAFHDAVDRVRDGRVRNWLSAPHAPAIIAVLLAIGQIVVSGFAVEASLRDKAAYGIEWAMPTTRAETPAIAAAVNGLGVILWMFALGSSRRFRAWRPWFIFLGAIVLSGCLVEGFDAVNGQFQRTTGREMALIWFLWTLLLTVGLLLTGAWDLRRLLHHGETNRGPAGATAQASSWSRHLESGRLKRQLVLWHR